jgi:hypothetical protein
MLDGSQLEQGRATWLRRGWPELFEEQRHAGDQYTNDR